MDPNLWWVLYCGSGTVVAVRVRGRIIIRVRTVRIRLRDMCRALVRVLRECSRVVAGLLVALVAACIIIRVSAHGGNTNVDRIGV